MMAYGRDEDASTRHYGRKKQEESKKRGPPPKGCESCRGTGAFAVSLVERVGGHRRVTDYACRCTCARGADLFRALPTLDDFQRQQTGEVLIEPTPHERAGLPPLTVDDAAEAEAEMQAVLAANPDWEIGKAIQYSSAMRKRRREMAAGLPDAV